MFDKIKKFCLEHKYEIGMCINTVLSIGGGVLTGYLLFNTQKEFSKENEKIHDKKHELEDFYITEGDLPDYDAIIEYTKLRGLEKKEEASNGNSPYNILIGAWRNSEDE